MELIADEVTRRTGVEWPRSPESNRKFLRDSIPAHAMNKRTFLKLSSAVMASRFVSPLFAWMPTEKLTNWSGNLEYSSQQLTQGTSLEQIQDFVGKHEKFKVLGTRHCFNNIADSKDELLSLRQMDQVVSVDVKAKTVTVESGSSYGKLAPYLDSKGFALHNLASLPHISIAGACSTATHGSGEKNGNLATRGLRDRIRHRRRRRGRALARERRRDCSTGAVVGLGALGVITASRSTSSRPSTCASSSTRTFRSTQLKTTSTRSKSSGYSVSLFTDWQKQRINEVWIKSRVDARRRRSGDPEFFGAKLATAQPSPDRRALRRKLHRADGRARPVVRAPAALPHGLHAQQPARSCSPNTSCPRQHAVDAILAIERLRDQMTPHLLITEIRTIAADDLWMSPCYQQACVTIHFTWKPDWPEVRKLLPVIEKELAPFKPVRTGESCSR